jgi:hypothetical protein
MAQIAAISIADGQATAVTHVFNPIQSVPPTYRRNGVAGQAAIAQERLLIDAILAKTKDGVNKVRLELVVPVSEVPSGNASTGYVAPPGVAHEMRVKVEFFFHQRSESAGRKDLRVLLSNLLLNSQVIGAIDNLEKPY